MRSALPGICTFVTDLHCHQCCRSSVAKRKNQSEYFLQTIISFSNRTLNILYPHSFNINIVKFLINMNTCAACICVLHYHHHTQFSVMQHNVTLQNRRCHSIPYRHIEYYPKMSNQIFCIVNVAHRYFTQTPSCSHLTFSHCGGSNLAPQTRQPNVVA